MVVEQTTYSEIMKIETPLIFEDDNWREPYKDDSLSESLALTPDHMPCSEKPKLELKVLPKNLRYEFLDTEQTRPVIVNSSLGTLETQTFRRSKEIPYCVRLQHIRLKRNLSFNLYAPYSIRRGLQNLSRTSKKNQSDSKHCSQR